MIGSWPLLTDFTSWRHMRARARRSPTLRTLLVEAELEERGRGREKERES